MTAKELVEKKWAQKASIERETLEKEHSVVGEEVA